MSLNASSSRSPKLGAGALVCDMCMNVDILIHVKRTQEEGLTSAQTSVGAVGGPGVHMEKNLDASLEIGIEEAPHKKMTGSIIVEAGPALLQGQHPAACSLPSTA